MGVLQDALLSHPATARPPHLTAFTHSVTHSLISRSLSLFLSLSACFWSPTQPRLTLGSQGKKKRKKRDRKNESPFLLTELRGREEWKKDKLKTGQSLKLFSFLSSFLFSPSPFPSATLAALCYVICLLPLSSETPPHLSLLSPQQ